MLYTRYIGVVPVSVLAGLLILAPAAFGVLAFLFRSRAARKTFTVACGWVLTFSALLLFANVVTRHSGFALSPGGLPWPSLVAAADLLLALAFVVIGVRARRPAVVLLALGQLAAMLWLEAGGEWHLQPVRALWIDWLSMIMVLIVSVIGSCIATYALPYMKEHERAKGIPVEQSRRPRFLLIVLAFLGAMNGLVLANDLRWLFLFWEVTTLCSFLLIGHDGSTEARENAFRALWMNLAGGACMAAAIVLLVSGPQVISIQEILHGAAAGRAIGGVLVLPVAFICVAGMTKSAQMPFHGWLLGAMVAPTPVSALLHSSTMVKAGVYVIVRLAPAFQGTVLSDAVAIAGAFTFLAGAVLAVSQTNAKRVLAYSTISNLGLIITCAGLNTPLALAAAVMLIVFHAISKGLLFMAAGVVEHAIGSRDIEDMQGLVSRMPLTTAVMVVGILSMLLPPFGVLIAKLAAIEASVRMPASLVPLIFGSTITVVFWVKWLGRLLMADPRVVHRRVEHLHSMYFVPLLLLGLGALLFSALVAPLLTHVVEPAVRQCYGSATLSGQSASLGNSVLGVPWALILGVLAAGVAAPLILGRVRPRDVRGAYMCGEQSSGEGAASFTSVADQSVELRIRGAYLERWAGEAAHAGWMTAVSAVLVALVFVSAMVRQ